MDKLGKYGTRFIGPFHPVDKVTVDGFRVPYLTAIRKSGANDGTVILSLDERFLLEVDQSEAEKWIPFLANAMAVAAGYSCHGENSVKDPNPFRVKVSEI